jgi:hypothetical protein
LQRVILAFALLGVSLFGAPPAAPGGAPGSALKPIVIHDLGDAARTIPDPNSRATVLLFIAHDCPVSNGYSPEMARICAKYGPRRVTFFMVYADSQVTPDDARKHAKDYGYTCPLILDSAFKLAHWAGATVTPQAVVVTPDGKEPYRGRIDNLYYGFGKARYKATVHDLRDALDAVLAGKAVSNPVTQAIGCYIPEKK